MAQKALTIYTPPDEDPHYTAEDEAQYNRARLGGSGITQADGMLACMKVSDNAVRLESGMYCNQGYIHCVPGGSTENLQIDSGTLGAYRRDLIVSDFQRGGGDVADSLLFMVVKGTPATSLAAAADPPLIQDDLSMGGTHRQEALYRVTIANAVITTIERVAPYVGNFYA